MIVCCAIIYQSNTNSAFVFQRKDTGLYEFPGGKLVNGESYEDCIHRELQEELSIKVQVIKRLEEHITPEGVRLVPFLVKLDPQESKFTLNAHTCFQLISESSIDTISWQSLNKQIFERFLSIFPQ